MEGFELGSAVVFECHPGYVMLGQSTVYCMVIDNTTTWSQSPLCIACKLVL